MPLTTDLPRAVERDALKPGAVILARFQRRQVVGVVLDFSHSTWLLIISDAGADKPGPRLEHLDNVAGPYRPIEGELVFEGPEGMPWGEVHPGKDWPTGTLRVCNDGELLLAIDADGDLDWFSLTKGEYAAGDATGPFANYTSWRLFQQRDGQVSRRLIAEDYGL